VATDVQGNGLLHTTGLLCCSLQVTQVYILVGKPDNCLINEAKYPSLYFFVVVPDRSADEWVEIFKYS